MSDPLMNQALLALVGILLGVVGFFLVGLIKRVEKNNESLNTFCTRLEVLVENMKTMQSESMRVFESIEKSIERHDENIEMIRKRMHYIMNKITAIKLRLEMQGIKFGGDSDWDQEFPADTK